jgi:hypothetical protein
MPSEGSERTKEADMTITQGVLLVTVVFLLVYTATAAQIKQRAISPTIRDLAWKWNSAAVFLGVMIGHWLFPGEHRLSHRVGSVLPVLGVVLVIDAVHAWRKWPERVWWRYPGIWAPVGIVAGSFLWGQL